MIVHEEQSPAIERTRPSLRRPTLLWLATLAVLLLSMYLVFDDLAHANKPHELHNAPWVAVLTLLNFGVCVNVLMCLRRIQKTHRSSGGNGKPTLAFWALVIASVIVTVLDALLCLGAASSVPAVLGW